MTENELFQVLTSDLSVWDKGKAIMELVSQKNPQPSALNIKPKTERKKREPRKPQPNGHLDLPAIHEEVTP